MAQPFRPPEDPLEDLPEPQPDVQGAANTSLDCGSNVYEKQELLHRPHAFALMHGENGAKVAYGELHWAIDVLIANFKTTTISVNDHSDHSHAPHANHSHSDHANHSHEDHADHSSHTHTAGVASHDHDHNHTHELFHTHTTDSGGATSTGQPNEATTGTDDGATSGYGSTTSQTTPTSGTDVGANSGYGSTTSQTTSTSGITSDSGLLAHSHDITHGHEVQMSHAHDITHGHNVAMSHTHEHVHTHSIGQHSHTTTSIDDATTDSISSVTTGNVNSGSGTVTTSGPNASLTHSSHSGVKDVSDGSASAPAGVLEHSAHTGTKNVSDGSQDAPTGVLKHSGVTTLDGNGQGTSSSASGSTTGVLSHNVTVSGGLNAITYCSGAAQEEIGNITQQVPNVDTKDGKPMKAVVHGENNEDPYYQLSSYGDVYLVWVVDLEEGKFNEITNCWVQIGEPDPFAISSVGMGTSTTGRRDEAAQDGSTEGTYHVKLGSVSMDNKITQNVTSDVVWSPTVMDRILVT